MRLGLELAALARDARSDADTVATLERTRAIYVTFLGWTRDTPLLEEREYDAVAKELDHIAALVGLDLDGPMAERLWRAFATRS